MSESATINEVLEIVQFLKDNAVTKSELNDRVVELKVDLIQWVKENAVTKEELEKAKSEIITHVDSFVQLHQKLDQELAALRGKYDRLEEMVKMMAKHLQLDFSKL